jgi:protein RPN4
MLLAPNYPRRQSENTSFHHHSLANNQSSSQLSTQLWYPQYSTPNPIAQTVFDGLNYVLPLQEHDSPSDSLRILTQKPFGSTHEQDLMHTDRPVAPSSWHFSNGQLPQNSSRAHHREASLSSIGSTAPSSPYPHNTSHPQVVLPSDSAGEVYYDASADQATYHTYLKTPTHTQDFLVPQFPQQFDSLNSYHSQPNFATIMAMKRGSGDDELMPAPEYAHSARPSVASTHDSPATPSMVEDFEDRKIDFRNSNAIPKLDRTMSDACNDELYSPNFSFGAGPSTAKSNITMLSPSHSDIFSQRLQAANSQHLNASSQSLLMNQSRGRSPFRQGSPLAPTMNNFGSQSSPQARISSAAQIREQQKAESDARALQQQYERSSPRQITPKTISPKDAVLEYHETEEDMSMPLFPPQVGSQYKLQRSSVQEPDFEDTASQQSYGSMATSRRESSSAYSTASHATPQPSSGYNFVPPSVPGSVSIPQQYPFVPQQRRQVSNMSSLADRTPEFPSSLNSMESTSSEYTPGTSDIKKPVASSADGGTYTCTYHGCTLRFETPAKLQKHKREGHRQSASAGSASNGNSSGMTSAALLRNSQAGPHTCERINPSTGKPCNTVFSRPYDLTRHEDTIHNARKQKVRCHLCTEEKTFSRNDALTRHMRVVHPEVDFPGKTRRRIRD